jgi:hypothetical protein
MPFSHLTKDCYIIGVVMTMNRFNDSSDHSSENDSANLSDQDFIAQECYQNSIVRKAKSKDPNYVRTTIYLPKELHKQLKMKALYQDVDMSDLLTTLVLNWLNANTIDS